MAADQITLGSKYHPGPHTFAAQKNPMSNPVVIKGKPADTPSPVISSSLPRDGSLEYHWLKRLDFKFFSWIKYITEDAKARMNNASPSMRNPV